MASSTLFRARRVVDPVPVQRGSLPRENKHHSSFSDLAAAWENVGEAKSALEAAEARINEANAGLVSSRNKERHRPDLPLQEIFSETQRYGRVTRYELRPGLHVHNAPLAPRLPEEERRPRRMLDFLPNTERHGLQRTVSDHLHVLSPPSRDIHNPVSNEGTMRNPHALQSYASGPSYIDTAITTYCSSANDPSERTPVMASSAIPQDCAVPLVGSVASFEDSLEVPESSTAYREARPASSLGLGLKAANANKSEALARLKERIKKQKDRVSRCNPESVQGIKSPISSSGRDESQAEAAVVDPNRNVLDMPVRISKRKVASAPAAPAYKGFSEMESNAPGSTDVKRKAKSKGPNNYNPETKYGIQRAQKSTQNGVEPRAKRVPPKVQRVLAPRRPTYVITTSSWRAGQQTVKRILGPTTKKKTPPPVSRTQSSSSMESELSEPKSLSLQWKADNENENNSDHCSVDDDSSGGSRRSASERDKDMSPTGPDHMGDVNKQDKDLDAEPCKLLPEAEMGDASSVDDNDLRELKGSKVLSTEAKNILSDLELDSEESDVEIKGPVSEPKPKYSLLKKSPKKRKAMQQQEVVYPTQKVRHYDTNEVKKYMAKQIAERKKKSREERLMKQKAVEERKKKLEELYNKQKKNLRNNLARQDKNTMGETYSKGQSDLRSIIHQYSHPVHQDHMEHCSEDTGVSESDKENLDIASFRGLPIQSKSQTKYQTMAGLESEGCASSPFEASSVSTGSSENDLEAEEGENSKIPQVTSVSVTTRKLDDRLSAYVGLPAGGSFESEQQRRGDSFPTSRGDTHPRSSSPDQAVRDKDELGTLSETGTGRVKHLNSPPRDDRIAAIKQTAAELKHRLESEARRLGINLQPTVLREENRGPPLSLPINERSVFTGALPGVGNVHEQADLNKELETMSSAATTIQAAYRGHSIRQGLNWKLPSGKTLGSTVRQARYPNPVAPGSVASESSQYSATWDTVVHEEEKSLSEVGTLYSSGNSGMELPLQSSVRVDKFPNAAIPSLLEAERRYDTKGALSSCPQVARPSTPPWRISGGDSLSVINIFARKNPHVILTRCEDEIVKERDSETAILQEATTHRNRGAEDTPGVLGPVAELNQSEELLEQTLVAAGSPDRSKEHDYEDDFTGSMDSEEKQDESRKRTPSCDQNADETAVYSETFFSPGTSRSENKTKSPNESLQSGSLSPTLSEGDLSHVSEAAGRSSVLSSLQRSPTQGRETPGSSHQFSPPPRPPPFVFIPGPELGSRISPGSLDKRLTAELNRLEYMEESVRQLTDVERTRSVSLAQQETVSLAQILKSKQLTHAREMENLRAKAREEALESAKQLEEARRAAANAATDAAQTISRMRLETATAISDSADRLLKVQTEAARTTAESAKHVEEARTSAARTLMEVAQHQATDTRGVAAEAASAAAEAAVKSAMARFHEQQEQILKEREALWKKSRHGTQGDDRRDNYSSYTATERTDSYSRHKTTRSATDALDRSSRSLGTSAYTSDDLESLRGSQQDKSTSIQTATHLSVDRTASHSRTTPTPSVPASRSRHDSSVMEGKSSVAEGLDHSVAGSVVSDIALEAAEDESLIEALTGNGQKTSDRHELSPAGVDYTLTFEESVISSHTATDDEIDYRMILPSESHRRRSLSKTGRRGSIGSDQGTVSYSSDDNQDSQVLRVEKALEEISAAPFSAEDSFSQFTSEMVRLMKEEEVRAKHQEGLLRLREKALKEKTRAEMAWLELQKQRHRDKGADDVMPSIRKRQRGVLMRLQAEQAEIKRLKAANRAASYERRLLLMQQEEIARLRNTTKRIRETVNTERTEHDGQNGETLKDDVERLKSEADVTGFPEDLEDKPADQSTRSRSAASEDIKTASPTVTASVAEELPRYQSSGVSRTESSPSYGSQESGTRERKRPLSEGESDEGSAVEGTHFAAKGSPTASDSTVMQKLKKLRSQSSERYLTQREQKLMKRRKEAESLLENKKKLLEWERRLDKEEDLVRNLLNEALSLDRTKVRTTSLTSEEDEHRERTGRVSASNSGSRSVSSKVSDKDRSTQPTESISESLIKPDSRDRERSASESSVPEEMTLSARDKSRDAEKSHESSVPEIDMKTQSQDSSIPEEIPEEYANDTFESVNTSVTPTHSTPVHGNFSLKRDSSPTVSRTSSKDDGSKSEEEASMTETSDHSDIESRVRRLKDQLELRRREVKRLYNERKRQRKAMLRAQEASLRKELQAVEMVISRTKAELNRPHVDSTRTNSGSIKQRAAPTKSDSSESIPTREVRYHLSRTSTTSTSRNITPPEKAVPLPSRSESTGGEVVDDDDTVSSASILQERSSVSVRSQDSFPVKKEQVNKATEIDEPYEATTNLSEKSRSTDRSLSLSQDELSERKSSIRVLNGLNYEFEEAKTEEDLSVDEGSEIRTGSKASLGEASIEERSQSLSESLSASRRHSSGSVRTRSARERVDSEVDTEEEVKTAEDMSASEESEIQTRYKESLPSVISIRDDVGKSTPDATDGLLEESRDSRSERSIRISEQNSVPSDASEPSRVSDRSRSSKTQYSTSFEGTDSEGQEHNDTYISEEIGVAEDAKEEVAEVKDSGGDIEVFEKTPQELEPRGGDALKDEEKSETASEVSEDILTDGKDNSEIEDESPSMEKAASYRERKNTETSREGDQASLTRAENEEKLPSYSADFEPSGDYEGESGSGTPYFAAAESNGFEEQENRERLEGQSLPLSAHSTVSDRSAGEREEIMEQSHNESQRDSPSSLKEKVSVLEQASDEESIAEEISEKGRDLQTFAETESIVTNEGLPHLSARQNVERIASNEGKNDLQVDELLPLVSSTTVTTQEKRKQKTDEESVERIAENLSTVLLKESMNCMTVLIEKRRRSAEVLSAEVTNTPEKSRDDERKDMVSGSAESISLKGDEYRYTIPKLETSETEKIIEHPRYSEDDNSLSGPDVRLEYKEKEAIANEAEKLRKDSLSALKSREFQGNAIVGKLSDALLKEAAAQMIAIMRSRQEKLANEASSPSPAETIKGTDSHSSGEESPLASPVSNRFMAVHRFPEGFPKYPEETSPPPGSPIEEQAKVIDENELAEKLDQLRRLHEHLDGTHENREEDENDRLEFNVISNSIIELPSQDEEDDDEGFQRPGSPSFLFSVPHRHSEVSSLVTSSLSVLFDRKRTGLTIDNVSPPPEIIGDTEPRDDLEASSKRVYRRLVFDLSGSVLKELLTEEMPSHRPSWMKPKRRRKRRFLRPLEPLVDEKDYFPVVEKQVLNFMGLGEARPSVESVRRKTPLKAGKKDLVDAILIQELREEEPSWIDYDDDELAVKFQVADAIFESLLSETVMVMNAVQLRREARTDASRIEGVGLGSAFT